MSKETKLQKLENYSFSSIVDFIQFAEDNEKKKTLSDMYEQYMQLQSENDELQIKLRNNLTQSNLILNGFKHIHKALKLDNDNLCFEHENLIVIVNTCEFNDTPQIFATFQKSIQ